MLDEVLAIVLSIVLFSVLLWGVHPEDESDETLESARVNPGGANGTEVARVRPLYTACMEDATNDDEEVLCVNACIELCGGDDAVDEDCLMLCYGGESVMR